MKIKINEENNVAIENYNEEDIRKLGGFLNNLETLISLDIDRVYPID